MSLPLDVSRCFDAKDCEMKDKCLRNDEYGRIWSNFRQEGFCNKENNYKMCKLRKSEDKNDNKT